MTKMQQTPIIPGHTTTVTLVMADANGNSVQQQFDVPPGASATLPDNLATNEDVAQMVAGTYLLNTQDQRALGLKWDGATGSPALFYGKNEGTNPALLSHLLGSTQGGNYLCANGNMIVQAAGESAPLMIQRFSAVGVNASTLTFPTPFAGDNVNVFVTPHLYVPNSSIAKMHLMSVIPNPAPNRYSFMLSSWSFSENNWSNNPTPLNILAIGPAPATV